MSQAITETQKNLGLIPVSRASMAVLQQRGIEAETLGLHRMASGVALVTIEGAQEIKADLKEAIHECADPMGKAMLASAYANIVRAETGLIKVTNGIASSQQEAPKRGRKAFAAMAPAVPIDVTPK